VEVSGLKPHEDMAMILNIPLWKRGMEGDFKNKCFLYDKQLKALSQHLRKNMTDAEKLLWLKLRRKQLKGYQFYRQKIIGKYIVDFYPVRKPRCLPH